MPRRPTLTPSTLATGVLAILLIFVGGCSTPLAFSTYPVKEDDRVLGQWELTFVTDVAPVAAGSRDAAGPTDTGVVNGRIGLTVERLAASRMSTTGPATRPTTIDSQYQSLGSAIGLLLGGRAQDSRYRVRIGPLGGPPADSDLVLDGELLDTRRRVLFTYQRRMDRWGEWLLGIEAPLQRTCWVDVSENQIKVWSARPALAWTTMPFAGDFRFDPERSINADRLALVEQFDDVIRYYGELPDDRWTLVAIATRVASPVRVTQQP